MWKLIEEDYHIVDMGRNHNCVFRLLETTIGVITIIFFFYKNQNSTK
jgi:hypothetical protein